MSDKIVVNELYSRIAELITNARKTVLRNVNQTMIHSYYEIGRMIVEEEQNGVARAEY